VAHIFTNTQIPRYSLIRIISFGLILAIAQLAFAQGTLDKKAIKLVDKAEEAMKSRDFETGRQLLEQAIQRDSAFATPYVKLFNLLGLLRLSAEIHRFQLLYVKNVPQKDLVPRVWESLAVYEFNQGNYVQAKEFISNCPKPDSLLVNSIEFSIDQLQKGDLLTISELPSSINRFAHQYLPVVTLDNRTMIYTARASETADEEIVISEFDGANWSEARSIAENINTRYNEGACSVSADGRTLIFTSCEGRQSVGNCDLFVSYKTGDSWSKPENLGRKINSSSWDSQPTLSADGRTLYFSSNRPGGYGGRDIWVSSLTKDGWSYPENLGKSINTQRDETTPFIHSNNRTLFFSSNGHIGLGGYDLYKVERSDSTWMKVENLGSPINSHQDELSLIISPDGLVAYFAKEEMVGPKIISSKLVSYDVKRDKRLVTGVAYITGSIIDAKSMKPLGAALEIVDLKSREVLYQTLSDSLNGRYFMVLPSEGEYGAFVQRKGYLFGDYAFVTTNNSVDTINFELTPISQGAKTILNNVYFDFDSDILNNNSFEELDRVVKFLQENPNVKVEISGHTDNVGAKSYNIELSQRRAKSVYSYILKNGISASRLAFIGLGDQRPLNQNLTETERLINRRIEFRII
jgi:OOP family OmpA-OmpF porin